MATHSEGCGLILVSDTHKKLMATPILVILFLVLLELT